MESGRGEGGVERGREGEEGESGERRRSVGKERNEGSDEPEVRWSWPWEDGPWASHETLVLHTNKSRPPSVRMVRRRRRAGNRPLPRS
jgi:hypothetical protein